MHAHTHTRTRRRAKGENLGGNGVGVKRLAVNGLRWVGTWRHPLCLRFIFESPAARSEAIDTLHYKLANRKITTS